MGYKTYYIDFNKSRVVGTIEGLEALKQSILMALSSERYAYPIYNFDYGIQMEKYVGKDLDYIQADLPREVTEGLMIDDRILSVDNFTFNADGEVLQIGFAIQTIYGDLDMGVSL